jgi:hypothetical protein
MCWDTCRGERGGEVEARLIPINAVLDLALADGLNPAPLAAAGWRVVGLEIPIVTPAGTVVCDVVLFNDSTGHILVAEAKSGANIDAEQARKLALVDPAALVVAGGITVPRPVPLRCEVLLVCLSQYRDRIMQGVAVEGLPFAVLAVDVRAARLVNPDVASADLRAALGPPITLTYPVAEVIRFDNQSPDEAFAQPVRAELVAEMTRSRSAVTVRAIAERVAWHFPLYGRRAQRQIERKVAGAARGAAAQEPSRLRFEPATGNTDARVLILQSPEEFDRRGRTQGYQAVFAGRGRRRLRPEIPGQGDLFSELDEAERVTVDQVGENVTEGGDNGLEDVEAADGAESAGPSPEADSGPGITDGGAGL